MPEEMLATRDVGLINLACSYGLPGMEYLDPRPCLSRLNEWADRVRWHTDKNWKKFVRHPEQYEKSEAFFRVLVLVTVLQRHCGLRYDPAKLDDSVPLETPDSFIEKALFGSGGTCATMPVVYAAVGRRLGYPIRLVAALGKQHGHLFARWDAPGVRFNIEATAEGLGCPRDDHYRTGRYEGDPEKERQGSFLMSQSPRQELAGFLKERGHCWREVGRRRFAAEAFGWASALSPENAFYHNMFKLELNAWRRELAVQTPDGFPQVIIEGQRRFSSDMPLALDLDYRGLEAKENLVRSGALHQFRRANAKTPDWVLARFLPQGGCEIGLRVGQIEWA